MGSHSAEHEQQEPDDEHETAETEALDETAEITEPERLDTDDETAETETAADTQVLDRPARRGGSFTRFLPRVASPRPRDKPPHRPVTDPNPPHGIGMPVGLAAAIGGFGLIVFAWREMAGQTNVAEQLPFLTGGGIGGLLLTTAGVVLIRGSVRRRDSRQRHEQMAELRSSLTDVRQLLEQQEPDAEAEATEHAEAEEDTVEPEDAEPVRSGAS